MYGNVPIDSQFFLFAFDHGVEVVVDLERWQTGPAIECTSNFAVQRTAWSSDSEEAQAMFLCIDQHWQQRAVPGDALPRRAALPLG